MLLEEVKGLEIKTEEVKKVDLVKPEEYDKQRNKSIKGLHAQGKQYYDPEPYEKQGMSNDHAKRAAYINNSDPDNLFEIISTKDKSSGLQLEGIKCRQCGMFIDSVLHNKINSIPKIVRRHNKFVCDGKCTDCGYSRQELYGEYKDSFYKHYEKTLLSGEPKVDRETFFQVASSRPQQYVRGGKKFFMTESDLFNKHTQNHGNNSKTDCKNWLEAKESFKDYIFKFGTDSITKKNCDELGLTAEEVKKLKNFRQSHYKSNGDGSYGSAKKLVKFAGHRHDIIHALHQYVEE
eukprot:scaffold3887_cov156-Skeletonema_menzelii.AAC.1